MKLKFKIFASFSLLLISLTGVNAQEEPDSVLNGYLKIAAENNPKLKAAFNSYLAALERLPQARALPDPILMFNVFASPVETRVGAQRAGISISQALPWFGQLKAQEQSAAMLAKARYQAFEDEKNKLFYEVRSTYYSLYVLKAATAITAQNIQLLQTLEELANTRLETNKGSAVDLLRVKMELEELRNQLQYLSDSKIPLSARIQELLHVDSSFEIIVPDTLITRVIDESKHTLLDSIIQKNPLLTEFEYELSALDAKVDVAHKMGLPSFNLGLSYINVAPRDDVPDFSSNGKDALIFPQVGVRIPLYRSKYQAMIKEKQLMKTSVENKKESKLDQLQTELEKVWRDYADARRRISLYQRLMEYAGQALDILVANYTTAGVQFEEVLRMERQLLRYRLELEKARADQNTSVAFMNYITGKQL